MKKEDLISETPFRKQKGFQDQYLKIIPPTAKDLAIEQKIQSLKSHHAYNQLSIDQKSIFELIGESYQKKLLNHVLEPKHFVLSGHEVLEYDQLDEEQIPRYLVYRYRYNKYPQLKIVDNFPPCLQIEPSSLCNFRCIMCYQSDESFSSKSSQLMGHMSLDLFKQIVDQSEGNIEAITLASRGEPFLNPHIADMLLYCKGKFLALKINTNASLLSDANIHAILSSDVQTIVFSVDAADKELYEKIRVKGNFDRLVKNLRRFQEIKTTQYPKAKIITRITGVKINDQQNMHDMEKRWSEYADVVAFTTYTPWQDTYHNEVNSILEPCTEFWRRMFVWQDGAINPCDVDYKSQLSQWNVSKMNISEIWRSQGYNAMRQIHLDQQRNRLEPCKRCVIT